MSFSPFQCENCKRVYTRKSLYTRHLKDADQNGPQQKRGPCRECPNRKMDADDAFYVRKETHATLWAIQTTQEQVDRAVGIIRRHNGALPTRRRRVQNQNEVEPSEMQLLTLGSSPPFGNHAQACEFFSSPRLCSNVGLIWSVQQLRGFRLSKVHLTLSLTQHICLGHQVQVNIFLRGRPQPIQAPQRLDPPCEEAHLQTLALTRLQRPIKTHRKHQSCLGGTLGVTWAQMRASHCMVLTQYTEEGTWNHSSNQTTSIQTCSSMSHLLIAPRGREAGKIIPLGLRFELVNTDSKCCTPIKSSKKITTTTNQ